VPGSLRSVGRVALADHVYDALYRNMLIGAIAPGARLNIDQLARDLHVSPTPLREALARLEAEEVVVKRPLAGYLATPLLTRSGVAELFDLRLQLEPWLAGLAADSHADWPAATETRADDDDMARLATIDAEFHDTVAALAGNTLARQGLRRLNVHFHVYRLFARQDELPRALAGHDEVAKSIRAHDKAAAMRAMRRHLADSRAQLLPYADD
jgi:DNA-binding GntR family transcriptional regulator